MINSRDLFDRISSHAMTLGLFETVNGHEPKSAPGRGLSAAVWVQSILPIKASGLDVTSGRVELSVRIYSNMLSEPQDDTDPNMIDAADALLSAYSADFDLGNTVRCIDLLGMYGNPLGAQAGYVSQDGKMFRVVTVTLPIIVNDIWNQE